MEDVLCCAHFVHMIRFVSGIEASTARYLYLIS